MNWAQQEPRRIDQADDLKIAPFRDAGASYGIADLDLAGGGRGRAVWHSSRSKAAQSAHRRTASVSPCADDRRPGGRSHRPHRDTRNQERG